ncbi:MAG: hypothetical protein U0941_26835 [Planctomycetaceae bacterium]
MKKQNQNPRRHETITVIVENRRGEIDLEIAPLIREIWLAGIETMMSCQEVSPGIAWIEFPDVEELLRFLNRVTPYEPGIDTLYNRICHQIVDPTSRPHWEYHLNLWDMFQGQEEQRDHGEVSFFATVGVYFPKLEITLLIERLRFFNSVNGSAEPME